MPLSQALAAALEDHGVDPRDVDPKVIAAAEAAIRESNPVDVKAVVDSIPRGF